MHREASVVLLGTGTSHGIPVVGCHCNVCTKDQPRNRCCALLTCEGVNILIDCSPEIRLQMLAARVKSIDYVVLTHAHADHTNGLDDLRVFTAAKPLEIFMNAITADEITKRFDYGFDMGKSQKKAKPHFIARVIDTEPFEMGPVTAIPIPLKHGLLNTTGYRFGNFAYLTDTNFIPESSFPLLEGVEILVIDGISVRGARTHFSMESAMEVIARIRPKEAWFIHMDDSNTQGTGEAAIERFKSEFHIEDIPVAMAYDMLEIKNIMI